MAGMVLLLSKTRSRGLVDDSTVQEVNQNASFGEIYCSPNSSEVRTLINRTLGYLGQPRPVVRFYHSAAAAEAAYLDSAEGYNVAGGPVVGIDFAELVVPSSANYSLRFRAKAVGDTKILFNHACE